MAKTIVVVGFGPGISTGVAEKFGAEGFAVALVARNAERLDAGVAALKAKGVKAVAIPADASDPASIRAAIAKARAELGPITALQWNAYGGGAVQDVLAAEPKALSALFDVGVIGLISAVQEALPDLKAAGDGAVLVTNGAFGEVSPQVDAMATAFGATGVGIANAAKHKLVGLLAERLKAEGVYVGEVMVAGMVKGTATGGPAATISGADVAQLFWDLYQARTDIRARIAGAI